MNYGTTDRKEKAGRHTAWVRLRKGAAGDGTDRREMAARGRMQYLVLRGNTNDNILNNNNELNELSIMKQAEREQLQAVLDKFDRREDECYDKMGYMEEHKFNYEKQAIDLKRQAYHECFRELQATFSRMKVDEWTQQDEAIAKEIIAYFRDGTVKLQHDLNLYATWLEKWVAKQK